MSRLVLSAANGQPNITYFPAPFCARVRYSTKIPTRMLQGPYKCTQSSSNTTTKQWRPAKANEFIRVECATQSDVSKRYALKSAELKAQNSTFRRTKLPLSPCTQTAEITDFHPLGTYCATLPSFCDRATGSGSQKDLILQRSRPSSLSHFPFPTKATSKFWRIHSTPSSTPSLFASSPSNSSNTPAIPLPCTSR